MEAVIGVGDVESCPLSPICPFRPFERLCSHSEISYTLVCPFLSTFPFPPHHSLVLTLPLHLFLKPSAIFLSFSRFPLLISATLLLTFVQSVLDTTINLSSPLSTPSHLCLSHLCRGIDLDPCSHGGEATHTSNSPQFPLSSP